MNKILLFSVILLFVTAVGLELLNTHLSGNLASDSVTVKKLQSKIAKLDEENQILNQQVLEKTSFENISQKATQLGFVKDHNYISLRSQVKLSFKQ